MSAVPADPPPVPRAVSSMVSLAAALRALACAELALLQPPATLPRHAVPEVAALPEAVAAPVVVPEPAPVPEAVVTEVVVPAAVVPEVVVPEVVVPEVEVLAQPPAPVAEPIPDGPAAGRRLLESISFLDQ